MVILVFDREQSFDDFDIFVLRIYYIFLLDDNKGKIEGVPRIKSAIYDFSGYDNFNNFKIHCHRRKTLFIQTAISRVLW